MRDGGSRLGLGTLPNGERVQMALLEAGDTISLGKVDLVFGGAPPPAVLAGDDPEEDTVWSTPTCTSRSRLRRPSTTLAPLPLRLVDLARDQAFIGAGAESLPSTAADAAGGVEALTKILELEQRLLDSRVLRLLSQVADDAPSQGG